MSGWILLWRKLRENPLWRDPRRFSKAEAWIDLLMAAEWRDTEVAQGMKIIPVRRGQVFTSQVKLAARWRWNRETVRAFLHLLKSANQVAIETSKETDTGYTLVTLLNYELYQGVAETAKAIPSAIGSAIEPSFDPASTQHPVATSERRERKNPTGDSAPVNGSKRPGRKQRPANPNVKLVIDTYHKSYLATHGTPPPLNGAKCGAIAKGLLAGRHPTEAVWMIEEFFKNPPQFYADKNLWGMEHILAAAPTLLARSTRPRQ